MSLGVHINPQKFTDLDEVVGAFLGGGGAGAFFTILQGVKQGMVVLSPFNDLRRNGYGF
jgi:hypothetical protein